MEEKQLTQEELRTKYFAHPVSSLEEIQKLMTQNPLTLSQYQSQAIKTSVYPKESFSIIYPTIGLSGEVGEISEKVKKVLRDNNSEFTNEKKQEIGKEIGDVCWYLAALANDLGLDLGDIAQGNLDKLESRKARNQLHGSGDNR